MAVKRIGLVSPGTFTYSGLSIVRLNWPKQLPRGNIALGDDLLSIAPLNNKANAMMQTLGCPMRKNIHSWGHQDISCIPIWCIMLNDILRIVYVYLRGSRLFMKPAVSVLHWLRSVLVSSKSRIASLSCMVGRRILISLHTIGHRLSRRRRQPSKPSKGTGETQQRKGNISILSVLRIRCASYPHLADVLGRCSSRRHIAFDDFRFQITNVAIRNEQNVIFKTKAKSPNQLTLSVSRLRYIPPYISAVPPTDFYAATLLVTTTLLQCLGTWYLI